MVGYDPTAQRTAPSAEQAALAGSAAGIVTRAIISPFDVLKIRFQVLHFMFKYIKLPYFDTETCDYYLFGDAQLKRIFNQSIFTATEQLWEIVL